MTRKQVVIPLTSTVRKKNKLARVEGEREALLSYLNAEDLKIHWEGVELVVKTRETRTMLQFESDPAKLSSPDAECWFVIRVQHCRKNSKAWQSWEETFVVTNGDSYYVLDQSLGFNLFLLNDYAVSLIELAIANYTKENF